MDNIKAILFDFGNVIINIDPELTLQAFAEISGKPIERIRQKLEDSQLTKRYEEGRFSDDEFREIVRQTIGYPFSDDEINYAWNKLLLDVPFERISLIMELKSKYPVYLLSNTSNIHIEWCNDYFKEQFGIPKVSALFNQTFYSYEMGLWKPDDAIYFEVLKKINLEAKDVLFIDDNKMNIEAAVNLGFQTILMDPKTDDILNHFEIEKK